MPAVVDSVANLTEQGSPVRWASARACGELSGLCSLRWEDLRTMGHHSLTGILRFKWISGLSLMPVPILTMLFLGPWNWFSGEL